MKGGEKMSKEVIRKCRKELRGYKDLETLIQKFLPGKWDKIELLAYFVLKKQIIDNIYFNLNDKGRQYMQERYFEGNPELTFVKYADLLGYDDERQVRYIDQKIIRELEKELKKLHEIIFFTQFNK